jgi:hypothetical protein
VTDIEQLLLTIMGLNGILLVQLLAVRDLQSNVNHKSRHQKCDGPCFEAGFTSFRLNSMASNEHTTETAPNTTKAVEESWIKKKRCNTDETFGAEVHTNGYVDGLTDNPSIMQDRKNMDERKSFILSD